MNIPPTKDERWQIKRLAARARGLYRAEKQALAFIADAQTMQNGVCSKALTNGEDFGYHRKSMQRGIHGRQRNGKVEYPGLLARGIVYVTGGYPKGGRAPGGVGLTPSYAINVDVLLTFIPEVDDLEVDPSEKNVDPLVDPNMDPLKKNVDPYVDLMDTSSLSSSPAGPSTETRAANAPVLGAKSPRGSVDSAPQADVVVVGGAFAPDGLADKETLVELDLRQPVNSGAGEELAPSSRADQIIDALRQRRVEKSTPDAVIFREYKAVFDRLRSVHDAWCLASPSERRRLNLPEGREFDNDLKSTAAHRHAAAELYRAIGRKAALAQWEHFLVNEDHTTPQRVEYDEGKSDVEIVERTWLLHDFVVAHGVSISSGEQS